MLVRVVARRWNDRAQAQRGVKSFRVWWLQCIPANGRPVATRSIVDPAAPTAHPMLQSAPKAASPPVGTARQPRPGWGRPGVPPTIVTAVCDNVVPPPKASYWPTVPTRLERRSGTTEYAINASRFGSRASCGSFVYLPELYCVIASVAASARGDVRQCLGPTGVVEAPWHSGRNGSVGRGCRPGR